MGEEKMSNANRPFPETAIYSNDCLKGNYIFGGQAKSVFNCIKDVIGSFSDDNQTYINNTIGIIGNRGSGKTSLLSSVIKTISAKKDKTLTDSGFTAFSLADLIDPKVLPNEISIVNYILSLLFFDFKNKASNYGEVEVNRLFQEFDKLNVSISLLSRAHRADVIDNPSDLYDIGKTINIKNNFESLVSDLLDLYTSDSKKAAFIISIDDFDLDSSNVHKMIMDIITFLPIKGLVFLISFDDEILKDEIIRQRIKIISDYGVNTFWLRSNPRLLKNDGFFDIQETYEKAELYYVQNINKFIPLSLRVNMWPNSEYDDKELNNFLAKLSLYLFGFSVSYTPKIPLTDHHNAVMALIKMYCETFSDAIKNIRDLRSRNQLLNKIAEAFNQNSAFKLRTAIINSLGEISKLVETNLVEGKTIINSIVACLSNDMGIFKDYTVYEDGDSAIRIQELTLDYWTDHPCASLLYEYVVNRIDFDEANYSYELTAFMELMNSEPFALTRDENGTEYITWKEKKLAINKFEHPKFALNGRAIARSIGGYLDGKNAIAKYQVQHFVDTLEGYNSSQDEEDEFISRRIESLKELLNKQWKGADTLREYRSIARSNLAACARRLLAR